MLKTLKNFQYNSQQQNISSKNASPRIILKNSTVRELIFLGAKYEWHAHSVRNILGNRFSKKLIIFDVTTVVDSHSQLPHEEQDIFEYDENITILNVNTLIENVLKLLGNEIQNLKLVNGKEKPLNKNVNSISKLIGKYCYKSLIELHVSNVESFMNDSEVPFIKLEKLTWNLEYEREFNYENTNLGAIFPVLRSLDVNIFTSINSPNKSLKLPRLEYLRVRQGSDCNEEVIIDLIRANPTIKTMIFERSGPNVLKVVADELPKLENLEINDFLPDETVLEYDFNFNRLKNFVYRGFYFLQWPKIMRFNKLESFVALEYPNAKEYQTLFANCKHLKTLRIEGFSITAIGSEEVNQLINANMEINELKIRFDKSVKPENVIQLIESCTQLSNFTFGLPLTSSDQLWSQALSNHFPDWTLTKNDEFYTFIKN